MTEKPTVGVLGATSPAGEQAVRQLVQDGWPVVAFSRTRHYGSSDSSAAWASLSDDSAEDMKVKHGPISVWIALCPIWVIREHFDLLSRLGARRIVCLSSTSQFTKAPSRDVYETDVVDRLTQGEADVMAWAEKAGIGWTVLRPTLIYGRGTDRNLAEIVRIIRRARLFPLLGPARGLRQPIYVDDVATASIQAALSPQAVNRSYNLSGGEVLSYREMIVRVFEALHLKPRLITVPIWVFNLALTMLRIIPRYRDWNSEMVQRMSLDMVFDHDDAKRDFGFAPRPFELAAEDLGNAQASVA